MILDKLVLSTQKRLENIKKEICLEQIKEAALKKTKLKDEFLFEHILKKNTFSYICEVKKASPSKGIIANHFPYLEIAIQYEEADASAISVLTEPEYFKGSNEHLTEISNNVSIPILRKDFTIDEYQIYEAKAIGADAILLICSILNENLINKYINICDKLGLSALVEVHNKDEIKCAINSGARIIGVNNRDLNTFNIDINNCIQLRRYVPEHILFIAESGIQTKEHIDIIKSYSINGVLIGESLMRSENKKEMLSYLDGKI